MGSKGIYTGDIKIKKYVHWNQERTSISSVPPISVLEN